VSLVRTWFYRQLPYPAPYGARVQGDEGPAQAGIVMPAATAPVARRRGCTRIALTTTLSIEAPGFYQKQGYDVAATIDCDPPGLTRYYMMKRLVPPRG
jgi:hypothetical protein